MTTPRAIVHALEHAAAHGQPVVLATVVRVIGSSYGGVGARMLVHADGSTLGIVSGGCLESDLATHARRVHASGRAEVVTYDTRADDDLVWGLGLGCNGLVDVLLSPLAPSRAAQAAALLGRALAANDAGVLATVIGVDDDAAHALEEGAQALFADGARHTVGGWGDGLALDAAAAHVDDAIVAGRRGLVQRIGAVHVAFERVTPAVRLVVCGSGPDAVPVARLAAGLGWDVTVVDHRPVADAHPERFPDARVVECAVPARLADAVPLTARTAAVVMSHHFGRDTDYLDALLRAGVAYVGILGPRTRRDRMLAELAARGDTPSSPDERLFGPVGLDVGGDGPEAIALAIVAEVAAVASGRAGGHLRDAGAAIHTRPASARAGHG